MQLPKYGSQRASLQAYYSCFECTELTCDTQVLCPAKILKKSMSWTAREAHQRFVCVGWLSGEDRARYSELTIKSSKACHVACSNPFLFDKLMAALDDIIVNRDIQGNEDDSEAS